MPGHACLVMHSTAVYCMGWLACLSSPQARLEASALLAVLTIVARWQSPTHTLTPVYLEIRMPIGVRRPPVPCQQSLLTSLGKIFLCKPVLWTCAKSLLVVQTPFSTNHMS